MDIWRWFCHLGKTDNDQQVTFGKVKYKANEVCAAGQSGVDHVCTRLTRDNGCHCGSTMRGLYCVWSYYRMNER